MEINGGKTLDEAMDYYMKNIHSAMGLKGTFMPENIKLLL